MKKSETSVSTYGKSNIHYFSQVCWKMIMIILEIKEINNSLKKR